MYKNVANQIVPIFAWDGAAGTPKDGDAANITVYVDIDEAGVGAGAGAVTEPDAVNAKGMYYYHPTQAETNGNTVMFYPKSSTADVSFSPAFKDTVIAAVPALTEDQATQLIELWRLQGLDITNPMTITPTSRAAGDIELTLSGDGEESTTVTRG